MMHDFLWYGMMTVLIILLVTNVLHAILLMFAVPELWSHWQLADDEYFRTLLGSDALPPISVSTKVYNDGPRAVSRVRTLLGLEYPRLEVILVNDGSTDDTMDVLIKTFGLSRVTPAFTISIPTKPVIAYYRSAEHPRLLVIDKARGGMADALNAGLNASRYPYTLAIGTHVVFERDALLRLARPFLLNKAVCAVAGALRRSNEGTLVNDRFVPGVPTQWRFGIQMVNHLRIYFYERLGWNRIASNLIFPGSMALFRREHLMAIRGFRPGIEAPGIDLVFRLQRHLNDRGINGLYLVIPDPVAWTEFPATAAENAEALRRRQRGLVRALRAHRSLGFNAEYGMFGVLAIPFFWLTCVIAPVAELLGYAGLVAGLVTGVLTWGFAATYLAAVLGLDLFLGVWTVVLEALTFDRYARRRDVARLLWYAILAPFGYRQRVAWHRVCALFTRSPRSSSAYDPIQPDQPGTQPARQQSVTRSA